MAESSNLKRLIEKHQNARLTEINASLREHLHVVEAENHQLRERNKALEAMKKSMLILAMGLRP
jgi:hypothetical protein